ncbi:SulP family inorganic anion transporter [Commensalibacter papalotli (ex Servin-Garciduenas et al. 2014)]|uniref:Sulfate transporter family protein n=1 Tax=Commensalibacter papalotli (ex Servin-Garciduenas et al. 2014) TaxID=1208583 RepID=W7DTI2_9PROT|nr:SulP family inorganic anion transporter [Commensalibacter papalotli (ex Servin-Garciduenas et al. 2014)]EUK17583.1 sulfate transporter family protein [Commensalibacter papalotli (ex Servin-Garciduenas et al. 2014)]
MQAKAQSFFKAIFQLPAGARSLKRLTVPIALNDILAGILVSSVAIPVGLAYANLMGVPAIIGLYACIIPVLAYAIFGSSPFLIIGPDTAVSNIVGVSLTAFALTTPDARIQGAAAIAIGVGIVSIFAGKLRLGFIANFLSRPILTGYLAGIGIQLILSQLSIITKIYAPTGNFFERALFFIHHLSSIHWMTFGMALFFFIFIRACIFYKPSIPAPVITVIVSILLSWGFSLNQYGIMTLGKLPSGLPSFEIPSFNYPLTEFIETVVAVTLISFSSGIITARSFAATIGKQVDGNKELVSFGIANIISGLFQSFTVTGADSRTAVAINSGGKTALVGISSAITIALIITFLSQPLSFLPSAILSVILISTAINLIDFKTFRFLLKVSRQEAIFVIITILGVLWVGILQGIILAVFITLLHGLALSARPRDSLLGMFPNTKELVNLNLEPTAVPVPHCIIYLFEASIIFFNEGYFSSRCATVLEQHEDQSIKWFILDASVMTRGDASTLYALNQLYILLQTKNINLIIANGHYDFRNIVQKSDIMDKIAGKKIYQSVEIALAEISSLSQPPMEPIHHA